MTGRRNWVSLAGRFAAIVAMLHFVLIILIFWKGMLLSHSGLLGKFARILESISVTLKMAAALPPHPKKNFGIDQ